MINPKISTNLVLDPDLPYQISTWLQRKSWAGLNQIQKQAYTHFKRRNIIEGDPNLIICAPTAAGKTEAAFFPILEELGNNAGLCLYVSPLKALINDQYLRLEELAGLFGIPVIPWHGDVSASKKNRIYREPRGIVLITPESLESILARKGFLVNALMSDLKYIVIDELHYFLDNERGIQLSSIFNRLTTNLVIKPTYVGLSATLGDISEAVLYLSGPQAFALTNPTVLDYAKKDKLATVVVLDEKPQNLQIQLKSFESSKQKTGKPSIDVIAAEIYQITKGTNSLIFPNTKHSVETYADLLANLCEKDGKPNEYWPHHGNLSKEIRHETEERLKQEDCVASAVCTSTLELGIDIGAITNVVQVGAPPSIAGLRQRLGRSGRRNGEKAIIRIYTLEQEFSTDLALADKLRTETIQTIASINLLLQKWLEPSKASGGHYSTLIQQILSSISQNGGSTAQRLWASLCHEGPFISVSKPDFIAILKQMGHKKLIMQEEQGILLLGEIGERMVNQVSFFAVFTTPDEYALIHGTRKIGAIPLSKPIQPNSFVIFGGKRWQVDEIDPKAKVIYLLPAKGGAAPIFSGSGFIVHPKIHQEMFKVLSARDIPAYLSKTAIGHLAEARSTFNQLGLKTSHIGGNDSASHLFTWEGDRLNSTIELMLKARGIPCSYEGVGLEIPDVAPNELVELMHELAESPLVELELLVGLSPAKEYEKWDWALPPDIKAKTYADRVLDVPRTLKWLKDSSRKNWKITNGSLMSANQ